MRVITRKGDITEELEKCIAAYKASGMADFVDEIHGRLLSAKIRFPLLEFCGSSIFEFLDDAQHHSFCTSISNLKTIGGNVLIGIILQYRLSSCFEESFSYAAKYIDADHEWYVSDIIGERVYGYGLLNNPEEALPLLKNLSIHDSHMVVRAVGPGIHYALKKGLDKESADSAFQILLSKANTTNHFEKKGLGWAAKTTAKFHPDIIEKYRSILDDKTRTGQWFRTKTRMGLERNAYSNKI